MKKTLLYSLAIVLIVIVIVVAVAIAYYSGSEPSNLPTFPQKGNLNLPFNQAEIVLQYKGDWIGGYLFQDSKGQQFSKQQLNGTGNMQLIVNRPNNTTPWIMWVWVQGGSYHVHGNLTLSVFLTNGTIIDTVTTDSYSPAPHIISLTVNMDNLTSSRSPQ